VSMSSAVTLAVIGSVWAVVEGLQPMSWRAWPMSAGLLAVAGGRLPAADDRAAFARPSSR
jgi:hypothetical protein